MDYERLVSRIFDVIQEKPLDAGAYEDVLNVCKDMKKNGLLGRAHEINTQMRNIIVRNTIGAKNELFKPYK